jgi:hypothetical protein
VHPVEYAMFSIAMQSPFAFAGFPLYPMLPVLGWGMFTGRYVTDYPILRNAFDSWSAVELTAATPANLPMLISTMHTIYTTTSISGSSRYVQCTCTARFAARLNIFLG